MTDVQVKRLSFINEIVEDESEIIREEHQNISKSESLTQIGAFDKKVFKSQTEDYYQFLNNKIAY